MIDLSSPQTKLHRLRSADEYFVVNAQGGGVSMVVYYLEPEGKRLVRTVLGTDLEKGQVPQVGGYTYIYELQRRATVG